MLPQTRRVTFAASEARPGLRLMVEPAASDAMLVRSARDGSREAFGQLVDRYLSAAHAAALAVLGSSADAEDVCQDSFLAALDRLEDCRPEEKFRPWLLTIVRNRAIDLRRRQRVRQAEPLEVLGAASGAGVSAPLRDAEQADARAHLVAAIGTLTDVRREVLLLHDLEGWTHPEIAAHLGLVVGTVRAHLFWARRDVRARLSPEFRGGTDDAR
jgi:RNA polymerase sigma-70 factor (ECF subfamily)